MGWLEIGEAPNSEKAKMYKVLKEVMEEVQTGKSQETCATWSNYGFCRPRVGGQMCSEMSS